MTETNSKEQDVFELPGQVGRKTGFRMTRTPKKDKNGLENLEDFFLSDDEYSGSESVKPAESIRRLKIRRAKVHKIALPEPQVVEVSDDDVPKAYSSSGDESDDNEDSRADELIKSAAVFGSPIKPSFRGVNSEENSSNHELESENDQVPDEDADKTVQRPKGKDKVTSVKSPENNATVDPLSKSSDSSKRLLKNSSSLTKQIALHQKGRSKKFDYISVSSDEDEQLIDGKKESIDKDNNSGDEVIAQQSKSIVRNSLKSAKRLSSEVNKTSETIETNSKNSNARSKIKAKSQSKAKQSRRHKPKPQTSIQKPIRHSTRTKVKPVAWWRNERVVYKMKKEHGAYVREVENVVHRPDDLTVDNERRLKRIEARSPSRSPKRRRKSHSITHRTRVVHKASQNPENLIIDLDADVGAAYGENNDLNGRVYSTVQKGDEKEEEQESTVSRRESLENNHRRKSTSGSVRLNAREAKWMKDKSLTIPVFDGPGSEKQIERTVAWAPNQSKNITIIRNKKEYFKIKTLFDQDVEFSGAGILELPVNSRKSVKSNEDTYFVFYVIDGKLEVSISHNVFVVTQGSSFEIPMGNFYRFENKGDKPAKLFFVQSKYVVVADPDDSDLQSAEE